MPSHGTPIEDLAERLRDAYPELGEIGVAAADPVYLVGGAVRDLLLGRGRADIDLVVVGDPEALATSLGAETLASHDRFATAKVHLDGHEIDIAAARTETYERPGALPEVAPATDVESDLARRDFSVNAMAIPLGGEPRLIDPHGGRKDLEAELLRVLHAESFVDDPTRAIRAARYAARFGFQLEPETERLLRATDLGDVSADRRRVELLRLAGEATGPRGLELLSEWDLLELRPGSAELATAVATLLESAPWSGEAPRDETILRAALGPEGRERELATAEPERPSAAAELARGIDPIELALARALGANWLDEYLTTWRHVALEIDGDDLVAAGIAQGPVIGHALAATLRQKLDGEISGHEAELAAALEATRTL